MLRIFFVTSHSIVRQRSHDLLKTEKKLANKHCTFFVAGNWMSSLFASRCLAIFSNCCTLPLFVDPKQTQNATYRWCEPITAHKMTQGSLEVFAYIKHWAGNKRGRCSEDGNKHGKPLQAETSKQVSLRETVGKLSNEKDWQRRILPKIGFQILVSLYYFVINEFFMSVRHD